MSSTKNVLITGNTINFYMPNRPKLKVKMHTQCFNNFKNNQKNSMFAIIFDVLVNKKIIQNSDVIIYIWPNSKLEALFQINYIISLLSKTQKIFFLGSNRSGIKCIQNLLKKWIIITKIDSSNHCILYSGIIVLKPIFLYENFIKFNKWNNIVVKTIPGVFSYNNIDHGTKLLMSTCTKNLRWKTVLDIGCGSGVLSTYLATIFPEIKLTLIDSNIAALESSKLTLTSNNVCGEIFPSNIYSNVHYQNFDLIISNPPLHVENKLNFSIIDNIIKNSVKYLSNKGEIRIVTLKNVPCHKSFTLYFKKYTILKTSSHYKVYQANYKDRV
ncbi:ribosomal RNA small subunit methyltransferase C [Buchnera aphidicola str. Bp (Baizongia pistaciae)]|uniref:Ribosomal RNA small subunit methyltransferase C n=1 Tax=Buchnera aphidicola subsp. Baizongia pistaciae (strain Bp) TaxID=224915 RepID=RSMC_BUCBP|nr:methyltransferase [Buchnera aphidicola]Q89AI2.1 RecName: Full=Ribosomal RNA small subunit methyltransferase C; AltName: Full=16S rRNA m2G1207 methyltransferase; AltName: Full=rRNA (guanine-N(2)-)-methyltransferase RsmC [Buchnera aphidicola str. Bp (Baizongia pistaciae)]AAO27030.1 ribosomal RNA small subunit methyltransferase C [Buchnera aphidicola str. Bp (Baizongia pistaciae)]